MKGKKKFTLLTAVVGIVVVGVLLLLAGPREIAIAIDAANHRMILMALFLQLTISLIYPLRWKYLLSSIGKGTRFSHIYMVSSLGFLVNALTPGAQAGGEPARAYVLCKVEKKLSPSKCFASIVAERIYDVISYLTIIVLGLVMLLHTSSFGILGTCMILVAMLFIITLTVLALYISINKKKALKLLRFIFRLLRNIRPLMPKIDEWASKLEDTVEEYSRSFRKILVGGIWKGLFYSFLIRALEISRLYVVMVALGINLSVEHAVMVFVVVILSTLVPSPPAGMGVVESAYMLVLKMMGVSLQLAAATMIIDRMLSTLVPAVIGVASSYYLGFKKLDLLNKKDVVSS